MTAVARRFAAVVATLALFVVVGAASAWADNVRDLEWHLAALDIPAAHRISQGEGVVVGLPDTGVDTKTAELAGAVLPGKEFGEGAHGDGHFDPIGHGTAMAGLIAGRGLPNGGGVLGIAPKSVILPIQTMQGDLGVGENLADGINWAVDQGVKVICIAGGTSEDSTVRKAVERALTADIVIVAAVGNRPKTTSVAYPARLPGVLAVGGTDRDGNRAAVSVTGPEVVVVAPAVDVVSTSLSGTHAAGTGTSDATAIVSGVAALVRSKYPRLSGPEVVRRIALTATDNGKPGRDEEYGYGLVNPVAALTAEVPPEPSVTATASTSAAQSSAPEPATGNSGLWIALAVLVGAAGALAIWRFVRSAAGDPRGRRGG